MAVPNRARHRLYVAVGRDHRWVALLDGDDRLVEFHRESEGDDTRVGDIYLGRIIRVDHGLGAAFVDIGRKQAAFLPLSDIPPPVVEGAKTVIQIEREGSAGKGPRATARPVFAGVRLVLSPGRRAIGLSGRIADKAERARLSALVKAVAENDEGVTVRASAIGANEDQIREEVEALRADWRDISDLQRSQQPPAILQRQLPIDLRVLRDLGSSVEAAIYDHRGAADTARTWCRSSMRALAPRIQFRSGSEWRPAPAEMLEHVECAIQPRITLQAGGSILIESTEAMTVIDVNAGSASSTRVNDQGERLLLQTNLAAADEIARQIRLRNIGGIIVIDFIDLRDAAARRQVVDRLRATAASDSAPVWIGGMSRLGLVELTRKRRGPTLMAMLTRPCPTCEGTGRVLNEDSWMRAMDAR